MSSCPDEVRPMRSKCQTCLEDMLNFLDISVAWVKWQVSTRLINVLAMDVSNSGNWSCDESSF